MRGRAADARSNLSNLNSTCSRLRKHRKAAAMFGKANREWVRSWEVLLAIILVFVVGINIQLSPFFINGENLINLFGVSIEKIIVALVMTFVIINGEIDLSVASVMGLAASLCAWMALKGASFPLALLIGLLAGLVCGAVTGFFVAYVKLPSLVVTLPGLIGYRGIARLLLEDNSFTGIPVWYNNLGTQPFLGPFPLALVIFFVLFIVAA